MLRFEELQMNIVEAAKNFFDIINMQVFLEQFSLDRESKIFLALPHLEPVFLSATASFIYDAHETSMSLFDDEDINNPLDTSINLNLNIKLPQLEDFPNMEEIIEEISEAYPDTEPMLIAKETFPAIRTSKEYEIFYNYDIDITDELDNTILEEIFEELREVMDLIYQRIRNYIDNPWERSEE